MPLVTVCCRLPCHDTRMKPSRFPPSAQEPNREERRICFPPTPTPPTHPPTIHTFKKERKKRTSATDRKFPHNQLPTYLLIHLFSVRISNWFCSLLCSFPIYRICCIRYGLLFLSLLLFFLFVFFFHEKEIYLIWCTGTGRKKNAFVPYFFGTVTVQFTLGALFDWVCSIRCLVSFQVSVLMESTFV